MSSSSSSKSDSLSLGSPEEAIARVVFNYPEKYDTCIVVRTGHQMYFAYNQKCTHLSCAVIPDLAHGRFHCPCYNGYFELRTGIPTAGPPRRPLERILLEIREGDLYAVGREIRA